MDNMAIAHAHRRYARPYGLVFGAIFQPGQRMHCRPRILEMGVGAGLSLPLYPKDVLVYGIDILPDMHVASVVPDPGGPAGKMRRVCKPRGRIISVNRFRSRNPVPGAFESFPSPFSAQLGFHPDFSLDRFVNKAGLDAIAIHPADVFHFCAMLEAGNNKQYVSEVMMPVRAAS